MPSSNSSNERLIALANKAIITFRSRLEHIDSDRITPELRALKPDEAFVTFGSPFELKINGRRRGSFVRIKVEFVDGDIMISGVVKYAKGLSSPLRENEPVGTMPEGWMHFSDERIMMRMEDRLLQIVSSDHLIGRGRHMPVERQRDRVAA